MRIQPARAKLRAMTLVEVLVVIVIIAVVAALLLPAHSGPRKARGVVCLSNQKQIALGLFIFAADNDWKFPAQVSATNGGSLEYAASGPVSSHFKALAPYLGKNPRVLICSMDKARHIATDFVGLTNENVSYFLNLDAVTNASSILSGDRYLESYGQSVRAGVLVQTTNATLKWSAGFHGNPDRSFGFVSFADGHAQAIHAESLNSILQQQPSATNRFCFP